MAIIYSIKYSDQTADPVNKKPFTIAPGAMDTTTSLVLPGQAAALYGENIAENFLHLLENFASSTAPYNPTVGQLWYDSSLKLVRVLTAIATDGAGVKSYTWTPVGMPLITTTPPTNTGTLWYDTSNANSALWQLKIYNAGQGGWVSVAEQYVKKSGDTITGSITSGVGVGYVSPRHTSANPEGWFPSTAVGPTIQAQGNSNVLLPLVADATGSFVVSSSKTTDPSTVYSNANMVFQAQNNGTVTIYRGSLNMNGNKVIGLANGTATTDAVNFGQLSTVNTTLTGLVAGLESNKVNRAGDTMTGALTISGMRSIGNSNAPGEGNFGLVVNGIGTDTGGVLITTQDNNGDEMGLTIVNPYGVGGSNQSVFSVVGFNGNTVIGGTATIAKATTLQSTLSVAGTTYMAGILTMDSPITSIVNARHVTTKEYVDTKIAGLASTDVLARVNPASPRNGDILLNGALIYIYNNGWKQVFPAQWAD